MAVFINRITWLDANGASRVTQLHGNASTAAVETALLNASEADYILHSEAQLFSNATPSPPGGQYRTVDDQATLWFSTASGRIIQLTLPAPSASIFLADGETVDPSNADVVGIVATVIGVVTTLDGQAAAAFIGGIRGFNRR